MTVPQISIIVPVYNVETKLRSCLDSILAQTYKNFEVILVNDGSTDESSKICDEYANKYKQVRVLHQKNQGASAARNIGITNAKGDYVAFCDSDDIVSSRWIEHLYNSMDNEKTFPKCCFVTHEKELGKKINIPDSMINKIESRMFYKLEQNGIAGFLWNSLYSRKVLQENEILLREQVEKGDYNEDLIFNMDYVKHMETISIIRQGDYCYRVREDSLSKRYQKNYYDKFSEKNRLWIEYVQKNSPELEKTAKIEMYQKLLYHGIVALRQEVQELKLSSFIQKYKKFQSIMNDEQFQKSLLFANTTKENQRIISYAKHGKTKLLYIYLWITQKKYEIMKK